MSAPPRRKRPRRVPERVRQIPEALRVSDDDTTITVDDDDSHDAANFGSFPQPPPVIVSSGSETTIDCSSDDELDDDEYAKFKRQFNKPKAKPAKKKKEPKKPKIKNPFGMALALGIKHITMVDVGVRNNAILRMDMEHRIVTHCMIVDLDDLCRTYVNRNGVRLGDDNKGNFNEFARRDSLFRWVRQNAVVGCGGPFDSQFVGIEQQNFMRNMRGFEATFAAAVTAERPDVQIGSAFAIPAYRPISADSVKAFFPPFFPMVQGEKDPHRKHGVGDVRRSKGHADQHSKNKRQAIFWCSKIVTREEIVMQLEKAVDLDLITLTSFNAMEENLQSKAKADDVADTMFMMFYMLDNVIEFFYRKTVVKQSANNRVPVAFDAVRNAPNKKYVALKSYMASFKGRAAEKKEVLDVLDKPNQKR